MLPASFVWFNMCWVQNLYYDVNSKIVRLVNADFAIIGPLECVHTLRSSSIWFLRLFQLFLCVLLLLCSFSNTFVSSFLLLLVGCVLCVPVVFYFSRDSNVSQISDPWTWRLFFKKYVCCCCGAVAPSFVIGKQMSDSRSSSREIRCKLLVDTDATRRNL